MLSRRASLRGALVLLAAITGVGVVGCSVGTETSVPSLQATATSAALEQRFADIDVALADWRDAESATQLHAAAERARNLVVGPAGLFYGDADGDGSIGGANDIGILPGLAGEQALAIDSLGACVVADVLGGNWSNPEERWNILDTAIDAWRPDNNTFPALPSHPQRIVGWATLALQASDIETAREYASHAQLHSDISLAALTDCAR